MHKFFKTALVIALVFFIQLPLYAQAASTNDSGLNIALDTLTLFFLLLAMFFALQLQSYLKGGEIMVSWRWLSGAAIFFAIAKLLEIANLSASVVLIPWLVRAVYFFAAIFLAMGFYQQKKVIS